MNSVAHSGWRGRRPASSGYSSAVTPCVRHEMTGVQRAIPAAEQVTLHALLVDVDGQLAARGIQWRAIRRPIHHA